MTVKLSLSIDKTGRAYQASLNVEYDDGTGHGYRLLGPKYTGANQLVAKEHLSERDAKEIRAILDEVYPPAKPDRPTIVVLCGSTKFSHAFREANLRETLAGNIVLTIGCDMRTDTELFADLADEAVARIKAGLDELHKRKIDLADEVLVLNVGGYVGDSTRSEIEYAQTHGKPIRWLEPIDTGTATVGEQWDAATERVSEYLAGQP